MPRDTDKILCFWPNGASFRVTRMRADEFVADGYGEWYESFRYGKTVQLKTMRGGLSLRVGAELAGAVHRKEAWAQVALVDIQQR